MRFDQTLRGLNVDAPIEFLGVPIGRVVSIHLDYDDHSQSFPVVVDAFIYPSRLGGARDKLLAQISGSDDERNAHLIQVLVVRGLRAQARTGNLLTGQLYVSLDFDQHASAVEFDPHARPLAIRTIPGSVDRLQE
jgi:paraquat-inducible protein B